MAAKTDAASETFTFPSKVDRTTISARRWAPPCGIRPHATVQITHGIAEHGGRYDRFARFLAAMGYVVFAIDLRGHGETAGLSNLGQSGPTVFDDMVSDIRQLSDIAREQHPTHPLIVFGHSLGSALTQAFIQRHGKSVDGAILSGTMGAIPGLEESEYQKIVEEMHALATGPDAKLPNQTYGSVISEFNKAFTQNVPNPTGSEWQTSDAEEIRRFQADPLCGKPLSNSMAYSAFKGFHDLPGNESSIPVDLPVLIIGGVEDPVGRRTKTIQDLITRYMHRGHLALEYRFYDGGRHEMLNEEERNQVHRDIENWARHIRRR